MPADGNESAFRSRIHPFRDWCGGIDPRILLAGSGFEDAVVAPGTPGFPNGIPARYHTWEFPSHWFPRGGLATRCIKFDRLEAAAAAHEAGNMLVHAAKQYTVGVMTLPERPLSLPTIRRRSEAAIRLAIATLEIGSGVKTFSDLNQHEALRVVESAKTNPNDDQDLASALIEINDFGEAGLVCDYFQNVDWKRSIASMPQLSTDYFTRLTANASTPRPKQPAQPLSDAYTAGMIKIAIFYIEELSRHIIRHAKFFAALRQQALASKMPKQTKKLALRKAWKNYRRFAMSDVTNWTDNNGQQIKTLPFDHDYVFPPQCLTDLLALISTLQMCSFQVVALEGAMRLGEQHTVGFNRTYLLDVSGTPVPIAQGTTFKASGAKGWNGCEWALTHLGRQALEVQEDLFSGFKKRSSTVGTWRETKPSSIGEPMRSAELIHLNTFVRRHGLTVHQQDGQICHRQFRKAFARLMAKFAEEGVNVVRQQLKHRDDRQTSDYILADPVTGFELVRETLLANGLTVSDIEEIFHDQ